MTRRLACIGLVTSIAVFVGFGPAHAQTQSPPAPDETLGVYAKPHQMVRLKDGRFIHVFCAGEGSPTVIMTAGLGDWLSTWSKVHAAIARKTRACAWDRAGFGFSDPSAEPQDSAHTTADLEGVLEAAHIAGPYIMLSHSMGSYESLLLTDRHMKSVVGLVLVDPSFPDQWARFDLVAPKLAAFAGKEMLASWESNLKKCGAELKAGALKIGSEDPDKCFDYPPTYPTQLKDAMMHLDIGNPDRLATQASDVSHVAQSSRIVVNEKRNYGAIPIRILTSTVSDDLPEDKPELKVEIPLMEKEWRRSHDEMAALSKDGTNVLVDGASHYIQDQKPDAVIAAVGAVVDQVRANNVSASRQR